MSSGAQAPGSLLLLAAKGARREKKHYVFFNHPLFSDKLFFHPQDSFCPPPWEHFSPHCCVGFLFFCCTSSLRLPRSSFLLSTTTSLTQHLSQQHHSENIPHTTSRIQHHSHNISHNNSTSTHTTSLTQHRMPRGRMYASLQQHHSENIPHTTSHTQQHTHNMTHTTSPTRPLLAKGLPRGRMYALASSGVGWAPAQISWQAQHFAACQGVGCTPWRRLASAGHRRRSRGRRSTLLPAKGSDVRPGVVWRRLGTGADFVAGAALCCLPRGRMYALASSGVGWAPAQISWQAQHFAACQGVGCTPWRRLASAGAAQMSGRPARYLPRGRM